VIEIGFPGVPLASGGLYNACFDMPGNPVHTMTLLIKNVGTGMLSVNGVYMNLAPGWGTYYQSFPQAVAPGGALYFRVTYDWRYPGHIPVQASIFSNDPSCPNLSFRLIANAPPAWRGW
jgi:hypothetical protein